jgi:cation transport ATPase
VSHTDTCAAEGHHDIELRDEHPPAGRTPAAQAGIRSVRAGLLPEDKAAAGIGAAMGGVGSDLALSSADVVVVRDDLSTLPALIGLSRHARLIVVQNLTFAAVGRPADPATDLASAPSPARAG